MLEGWVTLVNQRSLVVQSRRLAARFNVLLIEVKNCIPFHNQRLFHQFLIHS